MTTLNLSYPKWKQVRSLLSLQPYYINGAGTSIDIVMVDVTNSFVYLSHLTKSEDRNDFTINILPNASLQLSVDECIASTVAHP